MKDLKDKNDLDMTEREEFDFLPQGSGPGEVKGDETGKKIENSVDGKKNLLSDSIHDREIAVNPTTDHGVPERESAGKGISGASTEDDGTDLLVKIPEGIKSRLPEDFNFNDIGSIDLKEAEAIANEDILFLTEDDLIEGLEDFDLIPLKDDLIEKEEIVPDRKKEPLARAGRKEEKLPDIKIKLSPGEEESPAAGVHETVIEERKKPSGAGVISSIEEDKKPVEGTGAREPGVNEIPFGGAPVEILAPIDTAPVTGRGPWDSLAGNMESLEGKKTDEPGGDPFVLKSGDAGVKETAEAGDIIPEELKGIGSGKGNVLFFDDMPVDDAGPKARLFDENELEKATSDIVEITSRNVKFLAETGISRAMESHRFLSLIKDASSLQPDILIDFADFDYKYRDSELDFIDSAIFEDDYSKYIREIDDFFTSGREKKSSVAVEIFGMDRDEDGFVFDHMFGEDYRNVDLDKEVDLFRSDFGIIDLSLAKERFFNYLLPSDESLADHERLSIEEDISSRGAIIYEEDIEEIKRLYGREVEDAGPDKTAFVHEIQKDDSFTRDSGIEIDAAGRDGGRLDAAPVAEAPRAVEKKPRVAGPEARGEAQEDEVIPDITDNIVILEDDLDIDRFVREFPEKKAADLKGLLKYLDGLFEKLPENTIRNFANSEYFDLYVKILSDMGI